MQTFRAVVANTLVASVTNNFLWFALTFWVYLETRNVLASAVIGGGYMLFMAVTGMVFGTFVDRNRRKDSMLLSSALSLVGFVIAGVIYAISPEDARHDLGHPAFWGLVVFTLGGAIAGNLRGVALSTTVTLLVPEEEHDKANGMVGTVNGVAFAVTSVFSGLAIGMLGMGACFVIAIVLTAIAGLHLWTIRIDETKPQPAEGSPTYIDVGGALRAIRIVPGLLALLLFSTFNNFLGGVFMALMDPYGLSLMSVEMWGVLLGITSFGFILGGILVARRGLGRNPVRTLLVVNMVLWSITILFPLQAAIIPLAIGFFLYMTLAPVAEASEQTVVQRVVPFTEQGRVFGFAQSLETAASPVTAFLIGPIAQFAVIPFMSPGGAGAESIGTWFGVGPDRGMALIFIAAGVIGLIVSVAAIRSAAYRRLSNRYLRAEASQGGEGDGGSMSAVPAT